MDTSFHNPVYSLQTFYVGEYNMSATAEWIDPSTRPQQIENLVSGVDRYNPSNGSILEDYLYHQIRENEYDCLANLAILKL